jgi:hypothetical protein
LDIGDRGFGFGVVLIVVFDVCVYLLEDLDFLSIGEVVFRWSVHSGLSVLEDEGGV